ncbi:unnamed protein product [Paramecium pentaurelia]|uniref:Uncharacterized protein n=1 Tax=Paramecium pentaurelia TaxID=43138 RepID=A0A8S1UL11_9CILI|nr:unnamed protein product [Paramecium pentaurelia]
MQRPLTSITSSQQQSKLYDSSSTSFRIKENKKNRQMPQQMLYDKEGLYEENLKLKKELQQVKFELKKERQEHANFEKQVQKTNETQKDFQVILSQRARIKEQDKLIKELQDEVFKLKRNPEKTKNKELEAELEEQKEAYQKLQLYISSKCSQDANETVMINQSLKDQIQINLVQAYKQDNLNLSQMILSLQQENHTLQQNLLSLKNEKDRLNGRLKELEKQFDSVNKHMMYMRQEMQNTKKQTPSEDYLKKIDDLQQQIQNQGKQLQQNKKLIEELEQKNGELQHNYDVFKSMESKEKEKLQDRINMLKKQIEELNQKRDDLEQSQEGSLQSIGLKQAMGIYGSPRSNNSPSKLQLQLPVTNKKQCLKVNSYDIKEIMSNLKIKLLSNNIDYETQEQILCEDDDEFLTLEETQLRLQKSPFELNEDESSLLARYLIEDNTEDHILYDRQRTQTKIIIKSVYKKLLGEFNLFNESEKLQMYEYFCQLFHKYNQGMESAIKQFNIKKKYLGNNQCEYEDFNEALKYCDILLTSRQRLYLELEIFSDSQQLQRFNFQTLFSKFKLKVSDLDNSIN